MLNAYILNNGRCPRYGVRREEACSRSAPLAAPFGRSLATLRAHKPLPTSSAAGTNFHVAGGTNGMPIQKLFRIQSLSATWKSVS